MERENGWMKENLILDGSSKNFSSFSLSACARDDLVLEIDFYDHRIFSF